MSDFTNELLRLSEMREKGLISQEEFEAAKARLFGNAETPANETPPPPELPETREAATVVMSVVPPESPPAPPAKPVEPAAAAKELPPGIAGWSWGAFLWNWIWAIFNNTWIGLLALIPGVNLIMIFVLGAKGREWAWKNKKWDSVEHFNRVQRKWSLWGIWLVLGGLLLAILLTVASFLFLGSQMKTVMEANGLPSGETGTEVYAPVEPVTAPIEETAAEVAPDAVTEESTPATEPADAATADTETIVDEPVADDSAARDAAAEEERQHQEELARTRAEAAAAKAEAAKAKKEAQKAEKALADKQRREQQQEEERLAREEAERAQIPCAYSRAQPLTCSSRQGQPAYCDWNFRACGNPRIAKKESKTTCEGKVEWDPGNNQLIVTEGCRAQFVPVQ